MPHHFRSRAEARAITVAALLLVMKRVLVVGVLATLLFSTHRFDHRLAFVSAWFGSVVVVIAILQRIVAQSVKCPLCMTQILVHNLCRKHRKARKMLGSYRMRTAFTVLFKRSFSCPYCNEKTSLRRSS